MSDKPLVIPAWEGMKFLFPATHISDAHERTMIPNVMDPGSDSVTVKENCGQFHRRLFCVTCSIHLLPKETKEHLALPVPHVMVWWCFYHGPETSDRGDFFQK